MKNLIIFFFIVILNFAANANQESLLSYQSVYEIELDKNREVKKNFGQPSIKSAEGELIIDWFNNCDSWVSNQRMLISFINSSGIGTVSDISYSLEESTDGNNMKFILQVKENNIIKQKVRGEVFRENGLKAKIFNPNKEEIEFSNDVLLPHEHLKLIIKSLYNKDNSIFSRKVYEGTIPKNFLNISTFINKSPSKFKGTKIPKEVENKFWDVRMAYYEKDAQTTSLELTAKINTQGVVSYFKYDYPEYSLIMKLKKLIVTMDNCEKK